MIKAAAFLVAALIAAPVFASTGAVSDATLSTGGPSDSRLAAAALARGDFAHAARKLKLVRAEDASDPARLINLGNAYLGMGRMREARAAYSAARTATDDMLVLADGTEESSRNIAGRALRRLNASYASR